MPNATISDVAAQARVSIKTVSRVINNVPTVKPHTRERVLRVIRKLDYHPSPSARGLSGSRSYLINARASLRKVSVDAAACDTMPALRCVPELISLIAFVTCPARMLCSRLAALISAMRPVASRT